MAKMQSTKRAIPRRVLIEAARIFGRQGGKARLHRLTPEKRKEVAHKAAQARWAKVKGTKFKSRGRRSQEH